MSMQQVARYQRSALFQSSDLDETRQIVSGLYCDHRLDQTRGGGSLAYRQAYCRLGDLGFSRMEYGADVRVEPGRLGDFYLIQVPLSGVDHMTADGVRICSDPGHASIHAPGSGLGMHWSEDCRKFVVRIERAALERGGRELGRQVGLRRAAAAGAGRIAGLRHEALDHAVELKPVIEALVGELPDARNMPGRLVGAQFDHDGAGLELQRQPTEAQLARRRVEEGSDPVAEGHDDHRLDQQRRRDERQRSEQSSRNRHDPCVVLRRPVRPSLYPGRPRSVRGSK